MNRENKQLLEKKRSDWKEFLLSLSSILMLAVGTGAFLLLILSFLESEKVSTGTIGLLMSFSSFVQAGAVFLSGRYFNGKHFRAIVVIALIIEGSGSFILSGLNTGYILWLAMGLFGLGLGVLLVILHAAPIQRRPVSIRTGLAIGVYTSLIAGGNAIGAYLVGLVIDGYGYSQAFNLSGLLILLTVPFIIFMADEYAEMPAQEKPQEEIPLDKEASRGTQLWMVGMIFAFFMSSLASMFETLLPIYGLRAGLSNTSIGAISGFKLFMTAATRPFTGILLNKMSSNNASHIGFLGMALFAILFPYSGTGLLIFAAGGMFGMSFGAIRVSSLSSTIEGETKAGTITRRLSIYRLSMTFGQIIGPYIAGLVAAAIAVSGAIVSLTVVHVLLFYATLVLFMNYGQIKKWIKQRDINRRFMD